MPNHQTPHVKISGDMVITNYTIPRHFSDLKSLETKETCTRLLNWVTASGECLNSGCPLLELLNWFIHHRNQYYYCIFNCSNVRFFSLYFLLIQYLQSMDLCHFPFGILLFGLGPWCTMMLLMGFRVISLGQSTLFHCFSCSLQIVKVFLRSQHFYNWIPKLHSSDFWLLHQQKYLKVISAEPVLSSSLTANFFK